MSYRHWRSVAPVVTGLLFGPLSGCGRRGDANENPSTSEARPIGTQGDRVPDAEARLSVFLEGSLEVSPPTETNVLMSCVPDGQTDRYLTLARYRVLNSALHGDTVSVAAEAVSVAEETGHPSAPNKYLTNVRVRTDTLHW